MSSTSDPNASALDSLLKAAQNYTSARNTSDIRRWESFCESFVNKSDSFQVLMQVLYQPQHLQLGVIFATASLVKQICQKLPVSGDQLAQLVNLYRAYATTGQHHNVATQLLLSLATACTMSMLQQLRFNGNVSVFASIGVVFSQHIDVLSSHLTAAELLQLLSFLPELLTYTRLKSFVDVRHAAKRGLVEQYRAVIVIRMFHNVCFALARHSTEEFNKTSHASASTSLEIQQHLGRMQRSILTPWLELIAALDNTAEDEFKTALKARHASSNNNNNTGKPSRKEKKAAAEQSSLPSIFTATVMSQTLLQMCCEIHLLSINDDTVPITPDSILSLALTSSVRSATASEVDEEVSEEAVSFVNTLALLCRRHLLLSPIARALSPAPTAGALRHLIGTLCQVCIQFAQQRCHRYLISVSSTAGALHSQHPAHDSDDEAIDDEDADAGDDVEQTLTMISEAIIHLFVSTYELSQAQTTTNPVDPIFCMDEVLSALQALFASVLILPSTTRSPQQMHLHQQHGSSPLSLPLRWQRSMLLAYVDSLFTLPHASAVPSTAPATTTERGPIRDIVDRALPYLLAASSLHLCGEHSSVAQYRSALRDILRKVYAACDALAPLLLQQSIQLLQQYHRLKKQLSTSETSEEQKSIAFMLLPVENDCEVCLHALSAVLPNLLSRHTLQLQQLQHIAHNSTTNASVSETSQQTSSTLVVLQQLLCHSATFTSTMDAKIASIGDGRALARTSVTLVVDIALHLLSLPYLQATQADMVRRVSANYLVYSLTYSEEYIHPQTHDQWIATNTDAESYSCYLDHRPFRLKQEHIGCVALHRLVSNPRFLGGSTANTDAHSSTISHVVANQLIAETVLHDLLHHCQLHSTSTIQHLAEVTQQLQHMQRHSQPELSEQLFACLQLIWSLIRIALVSSTPFSSAPSINTPNSTHGGSRPFCFLYDFYMDTDADKSRTVFFQHCSAHSRGLLITSLLHLLHHSSSIGTNLGHGPEGLLAVCVQSALVCSWLRSLPRLANNSSAVDQQTQEDAQESLLLLQIFLGHFMNGGSGDDTSSTRIFTQSQQLVEVWSSSVSLSPSVSHNQWTRTYQSTIVTLSLIHTLLQPPSASPTSSAAFLWQTMEFQQALLRRLVQTLQHVQDVGLLSLSSSAADHAGTEAIVGVVLQCGRLLLLFCSSAALHVSDPIHQGQQPLQQQQQLFLQALSIVSELAASTSIHTLPRIVSAARFVFVSCCRSLLSSQPSTALSSPSATSVAVPEDILHALVERAAHLLVGALRQGLTRLSSIAPSASTTASSSARNAKPPTFSSTCTRYQTHYDQQVHVIDHILQALRPAHASSAHTHTHMAIGKNTEEDKYQHLLTMAQLCDLVHSINTGSANRASPWLVAKSSLLTKAFAQSLELTLQFNHHVLRITKGGSPTQMSMLLPLEMETILEIGWQLCFAHLRTCLLALSTSLSDMASHSAYTTILSHVLSPPTSTTSSSSTLFPLRCCWLTLFNTLKATRGPVHLAAPPQSHLWTTTNTATNAADPHHILQELGNTLMPLTASLLYLSSSTTGTSTSSSQSPSTSTGASVCLWLLCLVLGSEVCLQRLGECLWSQQLQFTSDGQPHRQQQQHAFVQQCFGFVSTGNLDGLVQLIMTFRQ